MVKKYNLIRSYTIGWHSGNNSIATVWAFDIKEAIQKLRQYSPIKLNSDGYGKEDGITFSIGEEYPS